MRKFSELMAKMSPERRARVEARTKELLLTLPTSAQQKVYTAIAGYFAETGYAPSYEAIGKICGLSSLATIFKHVHNLEKLGMLKLRNGKIQKLSAKVCPTCGHRKTA
jgi:SOS-response transcriptional repressor LexA